MPSPPAPLTPKHYITRKSQKHHQASFSRAQRAPPCPSQGRHTACSSTCACSPSAAAREPWRRSPCGRSKHRRRREGVRAVPCRSLCVGRCADRGKSLMNRHTLLLRCGRRWWRCLLQQPPPAVHHTGKARVALATESTPTHPSTHVPTPQLPTHARAQSTPPHAHPPNTQVGEHILSLIQQLEDFAASDALAEVAPVAPPGVIER